MNRRDNPSSVPAQSPGPHRAPLPPRRAPSRRPPAPRESWPLPAPPFGSQPRPGKRCPRGRAGRRPSGRPAAGARSLGRRSPTTPGPRLRRPLTARPASHRPPPSASPGRTATRLVAVAASAARSPRSPHPAAAPSGSMAAAPKQHRQDVASGSGAAHAILERAKRGPGRCRTFPSLPLRRHGAARPSAAGGRSLPALW